MTVADSDVLIDFLAGKGDGSVEEFLRRGALMTTAVTRFELLSLAQKTHSKRRLVQLLEAIPSLDPDTHAADLSSEIREALERTGNSIGRPTA